MVLTREQDAALALEPHERLVGLVLAVLEPVSLVTEDETDLKIIGHWKCRLSLC